MPVTLKELGVPDTQLRELAEKVKRNPDGTVGQFVKLNTEDCLAIYELAR